MRCPLQVLSPLLANRGVKWWQHVCLDSRSWGWGRFLEVGMDPVTVRISEWAWLLKMDFSVEWPCCFCTCC